jgi:hypothetical protein
MTVTELRLVLQPCEPLWELPLDALQGTALALIEMLSLLRVECERESIGFRIVTEAEFQETTWILQD